MSIYDGACGGMKISRASVVPQALPRVQHVIFGSASQRGEIGEAVEPFIVVGNDGGDLSLLKHELGDENGVRVARSTPGEVAASAAKPVEKRATKRWRLFEQDHNFPGTSNAQRRTSNVEFQS